jgi:hypothetical protein
MDARILVLCCRDECQVPVRTFFIAIDKVQVRMWRATSDTLALFDSRIEVVIPQPFSPAARPRLRPDISHGGRTVVQYLILHSRGTRGLWWPNGPRPQVQRPAGYVTNSRKKLVIVKRSHSARVVFQHCEAMRLRNCVCGLVKQIGAHMPDVLCLSSFMKCLPTHQLPACDKRQSYHSFIPRAVISDSLVYSLALIDHSSQ